MVKIKYVGAKTNGERAFKDDTGIEWFPGDVYEVSEENAAKMLRHPDVFVQVTGAPVEPAPPPQLKQVAHDQDEVDDEAIAREAAAKKAAADAEAAKAAEQAESKPEPAPQPEKAVVHKPAKKAPPPPPKVKASAKKSAAKKK